MKRISVLQASTIDQIAAGEVVASPASVVKELVENSLDALATVIEVEIAEGGLSLVVVTDNGLGIHEEDCVMALLRHATSKIQNIDDLFDLYTMGFRGEALASTASVSKFTLHSAREGSVGVKVYAEGGDIREQKKMPRQRGTTIEVRDLFYNVPARRKFQKKNSTLALEIYRTLSILSLAHPHVTFLLRSEKGLVLELPSVGLQHMNLQEEQKVRMRQVLGENFLLDSFSLNKKMALGTVQGVLGGTSMTRRNRQGQYLFVNQRAVVCQCIEDAVHLGFGTMLGTRDHPSFVLYIQVPPSIVDVNVHPQKQEVRFKNERDWHEELVQSVSEVLYAPMQQQKMALQSVTLLEQHQAPSAERTQPMSTKGEGCGVVEEPLEQDKTIRNNPSMSPSLVAVEEACAEKQPSFQEGEQEEEEDSSWKESWLAKVSQSVKEGPPAPIQRELLASDSVALMGLFGQYLFLQKEVEGVLIVDMQAARFRVIFDALQTACEGEGQKQILLFPLLFVFGASEVLCLLENKHSLERVGFSLRWADDNTVEVSAIPPFLQESQLENVLKEILASLLFLEGDTVIRKEKDAKVAFIAAQHACKKGVSSAEEGLLLYKRLLEEGHSALDPKGNKIVRRLQHEEIQKLFC